MTSLIPAGSPQPHTFALARHSTDSGRRRLSLSLMRNYIRKGGHGGRRRGQGLPAQYWENQGGRQAAAKAKAQREAEAKAKPAEKKAKPAEWWQAWAAPSSKQQNYNSEQQQSSQPASDAEATAAAAAHDSSA